MNEPEELARARAEVGRAIQRFIEVKNQGLSLHGGQEVPYDNLFVSGWSTFATYTSVEMEQQDMYAGFPIIPDGQQASTSLGLFLFGVKTFGG